MRRIFVLIALVCILVTGLFMIDASRAMRVYARADGFHVVIDAGHGGKDKGAQSRNGTYESDINLAIAKALKVELENRGVGVTMTRETEAWLAAPNARNKKRSDMDARRRIIERVRPDLVISIHLNMFPGDTSVRGLQTFYDKDGTVSKVYAEAIQNEFNQSPLAINRSARTGDYYILDSTQFPSVLVECGFLSNEDDERLLSSPEYHHILAHYMASAISTAHLKQAINTME